MIKLKDILLENQAPHPFIPHKIEGRLEKHSQVLEKMIKAYVKNGSKSDLNLNGMNLTKFPDVLKYVEVGGDFYCDNNQLKSLVGAPESVGQDFDCSDNQLTSLVGAPTSVDGTFYCKNNPVKFTEKQIRSVSNVKGMIFV